MLTVIRLGLPDGLRRSLGHERDREPDGGGAASLLQRQTLLRWTYRQCWRPRKGFRRLKAHKQLPILRTALQRHQQAVLGDQSVIRKNLAA